MNEVQAVGASPAQAKELRRVAAQIEAKSHEVAEVVLRRMAWWTAVQNVAGQYDLNLASVLGQELVTLNEQADEGAHALLVWLLALDLGAAEIVGVQGPGEKITLGVIRRGVITGTTGFPVLAYIVIGTMAALSALGLMTFDAYLDVEHQHALNSRAQIANTAKKLELVAKAQATGQMDKLAPLLRQIDDADARAQKSITDSVSGAVAALASGASAVAGGGIGLGVIALIAWLLLRKRSRA